MEAVTGQCRKPTRSRRSNSSKADAEVDAKTTAEVDGETKHGLAAKWPARRKILANFKTAKTR